jgi:hypothetical protein
MIKLLKWVIKIPTKTTNQNKKIIKKTNKNTYNKNKNRTLVTLVLWTYYNR